MLGFFLKGDQNSENVRGTLLLLKQKWSPLYFAMCLKDKVETIVVSHPCSRDHFSLKNDGQGQTIWKNGLE